MNNSNDSQMQISAIKQFHLLKLVQNLRFSAARHNKECKGLRKRYKDEPRDESTRRINEL